MIESQSNTILVVDDDAMNREVMEAFLESAGYRVLLANNGKRGFEQATQHKPQLIVLDVKMPDMDGYEVCLMLKSKPETQHIPVMIVTGFNSQEDLRRSQEVGAEGFISRPFKGDDFIDNVSRLIEAAQP